MEHIKLFSCFFGWVAEKPRPAMAHAIANQMMVALLTKYPHQEKIIVPKKQLREAVGADNRTIERYLPTLEGLVEVFEAGNGKNWVFNLSCKECKNLQNVQILANFAKTTSLQNLHDLSKTAENATKNLQGLQNLTNHADFDTICKPPLDQIRSCISLEKEDQIRSGEQNLQKITNEAGQVKNIPEQPQDQIEKVPPAAPPKIVQELQADSDEVCQTILALLEGQTPENAKIKLNKPAWHYRNHILGLQKNLEFVKNKAVEYAKTTSLEIGLDKVWEGFIRFISRLSEPSFELDEAKFRQLIADLAAKKPSDQWAIEIKKPQFLAQKWESAWYGQPSDIDYLPILDNFFKEKKRYNDLQHALNSWFIFMTKGIEFEKAKRQKATTPKAVQGKNTPTVKPEPKKSTYSLAKFWENQKAKEQALVEPSKPAVPAPPPAFYVNQAKPKEKTFVQKLFEEVDSFLTEKAAELGVNPKEMDFYAVDPYEDTKRLMVSCFPYGNKEQIKYLREQFRERFAKELESGVVYEA